MVVGAAEAEAAEAAAAAAGGGGGAGASGGGGGGGRDLTDDDYDTDEVSSESDEEGGSALVRWKSVFGLGGSASGEGGAEENADGGGHPLHHLPAKPLGELDDAVAVPTHSTIGLANRRDGGISSKTREGGNGTDVYFVGIIDILQQYNTTKQLETSIKSLSSDRAIISCVPPGEYANRFVTFLSQFIE